MTQARNAIGESRSLQRAVSRSLDLPAGALAFADELFADLHSLGTTPRRVASWLAHAGIDDGSRVLDLGCGKGGAAVCIAHTCGARVQGIDAHQPFVTAAQQHAMRRGVSALCEFQQGNVVTFSLRGRRRFDAAIMLSVLPALDGLALMAPCVVRGGLMVIDDAVRARGVKAAKELPPSLDELREQIAAGGLHVERSHVWSPRVMARMERVLSRRISNRAKRLAKRGPRVARIMRDVMQRQSQARQLLTGPLRPVLLLVRMP
jgi:SAM-dependent methyltransferase